MNFLKQNIVIVLYAATFVVLAQYHLTNLERMVELQIMKAKLEQNEKLLRKIETQCAEIAK